MGDPVSPMRRHPTRLLGHLLSRKSRNGSQDDGNDSERASVRSEHAEFHEQREQREEERERRVEEHREFERQVQLRRRLSEERAKREETPEERARYGPSTLWAVERQPLDALIDLELANEAGRDDPAMLDTLVGSTRRFRARIHVIRPMGPHLVFLVVRDQAITLQTVLSEKSGPITAHMLHWAKRLPTESLITVQGTLQRPHEVITGCSVTHLELKVTHLYLISANQEQLPFSVYVAERLTNHTLDDHNDLDDTSTDQSSLEHHSERELEHEHAPMITMRTRLNNRLIDLRTPTTQAIFRVQSAVCTAFRQYLMAQSFIEIHSPKLQGGASESGSSVFQVGYFGRSAFLAQSPQLYKQMCIAADMKRVFEIGPVFRAENSNTSRHLTEYTGLDLEMEVNHYYDAMRVIDGMLKHIFHILKYECHDTVQTVRQLFPSSDLVWLDETLVLPFPEGVRMLREAGYREEDGSEPSEFEDLATRAEVRLGQLVREKYGTDYYILDKFPASARPFYTLPDEHDKRRTNSFDIFVRGQEICTGGQRIHNADVLEERIRELGIDAHSLEEYLEGFRLGAPPHAGCGIGLERFVMLYLNLDDIRLASLFYRDPKSFAVKRRAELRHADASTNPPPWRARHETQPRDETSMQPLEKLIANYGDSSNTSWLDERFQIWRDEDTGAAVGFSVRRRYALIVGNPLCDASQYSRVITRFLSHLKREHLKPVWLMVGEPVEQILGGRQGWCTLTCTADQRVMDASKNDARHDPEIQRKMRHASKVGVSVQEVPLHQTVPPELVRECDERIHVWQASRKGTQVHLTDIRPWVDQEHRSYFVARDDAKRVCCLVVLAQLAPEHGYQVKWAMSFPEAPSGAIEMTIFKALDSIGTSPVTFGTAATPKLRAVYGLSGIAFRVLSRVYENVVERTNLTNKGEFREKLGTVNDPTYVCYPKGGLSMLGVRDILDFFRDH
ncbi:aspartate--tRNA ligase [Malassezia obtusa]|uniref:aspartate--tRNA ligase n=1 Tax=Malassezia obtusa TaxID=76774 RepID=A0AAF0ISX3_9BASI|nr:aspartate--tRNA ligase [Malassezia obtusa]